MMKPAHLLLEGTGPNRTNCCLQTAAKVGQLMWDDDIRHQNIFNAFSKHATFDIALLMICCSILLVWWLCSQQQPIAHSPVIMRGSRCIRGMQHGRQQGTTLTLSAFRCESTDVSLAQRLHPVTPQSARETIMQSNFAIWSRVAPSAYFKTAVGSSAGHKVLSRWWGSAFGCHCTS